jgi:mRNA interferase RelE/StbE
LAYRIEIRRQAIKDLARIERKDRQRIAAAIDELAHNPRPAGCKKLRHREGWRVRVGEYRILYCIEEEMLLVLVVKKRTADKAKAICR